MRTSFHHQPEAQHPNFQLPISWQADYPIFRDEADRDDRLALIYALAIDPFRTSAAKFAVMYKRRFSVQERAMPWTPSPIRIQKSETDKLPH